MCLHGADISPRDVPWGPMGCPVGSHGMSRGIPWERVVPVGQRRRVFLGREGAR